VSQIWSTAQKRAIAKVLRRRAQIAPKEEKPKHLKRASVLLALARVQDLAELPLSGNAAKKLLGYVKSPPLQPTNSPE
jgi:hypothetical protein